MYTIREYHSFQHPRDVEVKFYVDLDPVFCYYYAYGSTSRFNEQAHVMYMGRARIMPAQLVNPSMTNTPVVRCVFYPPASQPRAFCS